jgi:hypothetical protein
MVMKAIILIYLGNIMEKLIENKILLMFSHHMKKTGINLLKLQEEKILKASLTDL